MRHYSELSPLEKKAREASEMFIDACDFIYLSAFKTGYNTRKKKTRRLKKKK